ncbi:hypothetical protein RB653_000817 [Dictyostelium firmibasis]|uniref:Uncharacterized protein n=1 Tax=Dictyostelium firmibasis TaxID=79012 RepID=A0AAN7U399_9MYCE
MKSFIIFLLIISFKSIIAFGQGLFVNFVPFLTEKCNEEPFGIGFSILSGVCINNLGSFLQNGQKTSSSWYFEITEYEKSTIISGFNYPDSDCSGFPEVSRFVYGVECVNSPVIVPINATFSGYDFSSYYTHVSLSKVPMFPDDSVVRGVYSNADGSSDGSGDTCTFDNFVYGTVITNNLLIKYQFPFEYTDTYSCSSNGTAYINMCEENEKCLKKNISLECNSDESNGHTQIFCS